MPGRFLSELERERLSQFPPEISAEDLITYFTLSARDLVFLADRRGDPNRLGLALQVGTLRYLGFCPDNLADAPATVVTNLADQLQVNPTVLADYGRRSQTRTEHLQEVMAYLGFRLAEPGDLEALKCWLVERAMEHDRPTLLFQLAAERLYTARIVRPGITILERLVMSARDQAQQETFRRLEPLLTPERCTVLDNLLISKPPPDQTLLNWLRQEATTNSPRAILSAIEKLTFLRQQGVDTWDLRQFSPNRSKQLAQLAQKSTSQALRRAPKERRYPILLAFLAQRLIETTDEVVDLYIRCLAETDARARRDLDEFRQTVARSTNETLHLFQALGGILLDPEIADEQVRAAIYQAIPKERLQTAVEECERIVRPLDDNYFDFLASRYSYIRQFAPAFLEACRFRSHLKSYALLEAITLLRQLNQEQQRKLPETATLAFVRPKWLPYVVEAEGQINRRYYELCVLWELRNDLRAGNIWLENSRLYADPESYLIPRAQWPARQPEVCQLIQAPADGSQRLNHHQVELETLLSQLDQALTNPDQVRLEEGRLVLSPLRAEEIPESSQKLQLLITDRLPRIELADLLIEVDGWVGFTRHFEHINGVEPRTQDLPTYLYAALMTQACNFGLTQMAAISDISYRRLAWCTTWYIREETLKAAIVALVNFQYQQPLSVFWGGGALSSSDGQRFPVAVKTSTATALPRYFGYGRGLTFYTWTSDQFSQFGTKVIPATVRDATYVLDEILDNETELSLLEHTTDTAGYTEMVFALFDLLGLQFAPRIRDLSDQRLYRMDRSSTYRHLEPLLTRTINSDHILPHWDDLLRVAGSLKLGWVTASLFISKLQAFPRQSTLARALQEYGRLIKTIFVLRYLQSEAYRRKINLQLNKGEALHALRRFIFFANQGKLRRHQSEEQANQASCLNLVTNAVIIWNTVYMAAVLGQLKGEGVRVEEADLIHLSPARYEHINPYGKYQFKVDETLSWDRLHPLRQPQSA
jgi:TnpA family transposase